jgi:hypothetical protein
VLVDDHSDYFLYNKFLPDEMWFHQVQGTTYWLGIFPVVTDPVTASWGWKSSAVQWNDDAVYRDPEGDSWVDLHTPPFDGFYDYVPGDMNGDGLVNWDDIAYYNCWYMGICGPPPEYDGFYASADANADCMFSTGDAVFLISYLNGDGNPPFCCELFPTLLCAPSLDLAFVVNGETDICDCNPGDANGDGSVNIGDAVSLISYVFKDGPEPTPYMFCSGDANGDCEANIGDAVFIINYVFCLIYPCPAPVTCEEWLNRCGPPLR